MIMMRNARSNVYEWIDGDIDQLHDVRTRHELVHYSHCLGADDFMELLSYKIQK